MSSDSLLSFPHYYYIQQQYVIQMSKRGIVLFSRKQYDLWGGQNGILQLCLFILKFDSRLWSLIKGPINRHSKFTDRVNICM